MKLGKRLILWAYRSEPKLHSQAGCEHESDPDTFTVWLYLGLFGIALSWSRQGWLKPNEATGQRATQMIIASDPQRHGDEFEDAWDALDRGAEHRGWTDVHYK